MIALKTVTLTILMLNIGINTFDNNSSATDILKKVATKYNTLKTYKCIGTRTSVEKSDTGIEKSEHTFTILLKKPNMYLITWTSASTVSGDCIALWSNGTQPYLYRLHTYNKMTNEDMAFKNAGIFGLPSLIPGLFLPCFKRDEVPFSWLKDPKVEKVEKIGEEDCYVIIGSSDLSKKVIMWISKSRYLIEKIEYSREPPEGGRRRPGMTEEQKEREKIIAEDYKRRNISSSYIEVYAEISSPELDKKDFNFTLPDDAIFRDDWPKN